MCPTVAGTEGQGEQSGDTCVDNLYLTGHHIFEGHCVCVQAYWHQIHYFVLVFTVNRQGVLVTLVAAGWACACG